MKVGTGKYTYELVQDWGEVPAGWELGWIPGVAVDSLDRVYAFCRSDPPVIIFNREGDFIGSWGGDVLKGAHGIFIGPDDSVYCIDWAAHVVRKFTSDGRLLLTIGKPDCPASDGEPFNRPTDAAVSPTGEIYVSDGYGQSRVHKFSPTGELLLSWGTPGDGPGQFDLPHCVWFDRRGRVLVVDRGNNRIQVFDPDGEFICQWTGFLLPDDLYVDDQDIVYVAELEKRVSILNLDGEVLARWGNESHDAPSPFLGSPHGIWADSHGDLYVSGVHQNHSLQKFARCAPGEEG